MTTGPSTQFHVLTPPDRFRLWAACAVSATVLWLAWTIPFPVSADDAIAASENPAIHGALNAGWWAVIVAATAVAVGSVVAVAIAYQRGRNWTRTALRSALQLTAVLGGLRFFWIVTVLGALDKAAR